MALQSVPLNSCRQVLQKCSPHLSRLSHPGSVRRSSAPCGMAGAPGAVSENRRVVATIAIHIGAATTASSITAVVISSLVLPVLAWASAHRVGVRGNLSSWAWMRQPAVTMILRLDHRLSAVHKVHNLLHYRPLGQHENPWEKFS